MSAPKTNRLVTAILLATGLGLSTVPLSAQTTQTRVEAHAQTTAPTPAVRKKVQTTVVNREVVDKPAPPQVVTILHTLSGIKVLRMLVRSKEQVEAIAKLDEAFKLAGVMHTNVIAGLALDDGRTIVAWLPEAEAELPPRVPFTPHRAPAAKPGTAPKPIDVPAPGVTAPPPPAMTPVGVPGVGYHGSLLEPADLRVITRDGKRITGHYVGLDGLTGLSLITLPSGNVAQAAAASEDAVQVGQKLRVIGPRPAAGAEGGAKNSMYIRIGETEAVVVGVTRSPSGGMARLKIKSANFSQVNIGGIAINETGETLGIVDSVRGEAATVVPVAMVKSAAKRVLARQASVPRPWLGIRGEPIEAMTFERIQQLGYAVDRARALAEKRRGILLTSVAPNSPAAQAKLKPGDVILTVNEGDIRNAEEFSWLLDEASPDNAVRFTVARPGKQDFESFDIRLSESPDPFFGLKRIPEYFPKTFKFKWPFADGIETVALKPRVAMRLGSSGGLLVVSVQPETEAFKAGLRAGDVIESVDGRPVYSGTAMVMFPKGPATSSTCIVVRNKEKITLSFKYEDSFPKGPE
jgi:S1-C subfamily serine protease